jgi:hypothetical protein
LSSKNSNTAATAAIAMKLKEMSKAAPFQRFWLLNEWKHFTVTDPITADLPDGADQGPFTAKVAEDAKESKLITADQRG